MPPWLGYVVLGLIGVATLVLLLLTWRLLVRLSTTTESLRRQSVADADVSRVHERWRVGRLRLTEANRAVVAAERSLPQFDRGLDRAVVTLFRARLMIEMSTDDVIDALRLLRRRVKRTAELVDWIRSVPFA